MNHYFGLRKCISKWASLVAQTAKNLPAMQETQVGSLGQEDPWKREWQPSPVFLSGKTQRREDPGGPQAMGSQNQTRLSDQHSE